MNTYKNPAEMSTEELIELASLIIELDKIPEGGSPEKTIGLVTTIQTKIRTPEALVEAVEAELSTGAADEPSTEEDAAA